MELIYGIIENERLARENGTIDEQHCAGIAL